MIGFALMISSAHNEPGWTRHGAQSQEPGRCRVCSVGGCRDENYAALRPGLMSEITHQNNQTFTNSPPTGNNSAVKLEINQMCVGQTVGCQTLIQHVCKMLQIVHCLQFIDDINYMDYLYQLGSLVPGL